MNSLLEKWRFLLLGGDYASKDIANKINNDCEEAINNIWEDSDTISEKSFYGTNRLFKVYGRLYKMAVAYATFDSKYYKSDSLKQKIDDALLYLYDNFFDKNLYTEFKHNDGGDFPYGNWWHWQIGIATDILNIFTIISVDENLKSKYLDSLFSIYLKTPFRTGANKVWTAKVHIIGAILKNDEEMLKNGVEHLKSEIKFVEESDGFYKDGSFIQHYYHGYTGGYGISFIYFLSEVLYILKDTKYEVSDAESGILKEIFHNSFEPLMFNCNIMAMIRGREISRSKSNDFKRGKVALIASLTLAYGVKNADSIKSRIKEWILSFNSIEDLYSGYSKFQTILIDNLLSCEYIKPSEKLKLCKVFPAMDKGVQITENYAVAISMFSKRIANYESINDENLKGWHTSDGMMLIYNRDNLKYNGGFWATIDKKRLSGTTVEPIEYENSYYCAQKSPESFVGGCTDGEIGICSMILNSFGGAVYAKKSWFMLSESVVCLGSDIKGKNLETIIENHKITADTKIIENENSISIDDVLYYYPNESVNIKKETRKDAWYSANLLEKKDNLSVDDYVTVWISHSDEKNCYEYMVFPEANTENMPEILENSEKAHAVKLGNIKGFVFFKDEEHAVDFITCSRKAVILTKEYDDKFEIFVSDPTQENAGTIDIKINGILLKADVYNFKGETNKYEIFKFTN